ncbi:hypothetical protein COO60DRAFT_1643788 [Scenedesmus sp. NREL 46B-D3]|nr:hypothetical protein COO60DRAFT_1643788 [Scenedesmus sp. NREL 46B-D3]
MGGKDAFIAVQSVACCAGLHPYQDRSAALLRKAAQLRNAPALGATAAADPLLARFPSVAEGVAAIPKGCTLQECQHAVTRIVDGFVGLNGLENEQQLADLGEAVRDAAFRKCNTRPTLAQLTTAMSWVSHTHGIALSVPRTSFHKRPLDGLPGWYLCGSADLVGDGLVVITKLRLSRLKYALAPHEEAHLQALMHLMDVQSAALLEVHATEGMSMQRLDRKAEEWASLTAALLSFAQEALVEAARPESTC